MISHSLFSCSNVTLSIGLLSYTFLRTMKDDIVVPMVCEILKRYMFQAMLFVSQGLTFSIIVAARF